VTVLAAASLSEHPLPTHAVGEATGAVLEQIGQRPDVAAVFVTNGHAGALEDIAGTVRSILRPRVLVGAAALSIVGGHREVEDRPGVVVWAARPGSVEPVRIATRREDSGWTVEGLPARAADRPRTLVLLADPFTFPTDGVLDRLSQSCPDLTIVGGLTSGSQGAGGARLALDDKIYSDGAVGFLLAPDADVEAIVSQGCRPIGEPFVVTRSEQNIIFELGGKPALHRLREVLEMLDPGDRALAAQGLQVGMVIDERHVTFESGDFLIRNVIGADTTAEAVGIADVAPVGQTIQFHLRDALAADADLRAALAPRRGDGALLFTCTGRGQGLFGYPDHDADVVSSSLSTRATAGFFASGEIGPVAGRNFLHGFSSSILVFGPRTA
jgi:small ligand-binding sensory domain FIST